MTKKGKKQEEQATNRFIRSIRLRNLLSFGPDSEEIELQPLNVLIGPNASGKSNFIEAISLLKAAPADIQGAIRRGGGIGDWLWKRGEENPAVAEVGVKAYELDTLSIGHVISFTEIGQRFQVENEGFVRIDPGGSWHSVTLLTDGSATDPRQSILKHPLHFLADTAIVQRAIVRLSKDYADIRLFRDWRLDSNSPARAPQSTDLQEDFLLDDASNLHMVLNDLQHRVEAADNVRKYLRKLYDGFEDFTTRLRGGTAQTILREWGGTFIPANRISAGTLRYLCLLVILCHPEPPPLICIEEPELGLHPDVIGTIAELLVEASQRTQLIVTTHSEILVSALSDTPESILVCEQDASGTKMRRLESEKLKEWLKEYSLGDLWAMGEIGGSRW